MKDITVFSIDPGNIESAYTIWNGKEILEFGKVKNEELISILSDPKMKHVKYHFVIEMIASYGLATGASIYDTCVFIGRYYQKIIDTYPVIPNLSLVFRREVKMHLCHSMKAKDGNIRQALIDRFEPELQAKQRPKGILKGLTADCWQAFALAVTYYDQHQ